GRMTGQRLLTCVACDGKRPFHPLCGGAKRARRSASQTTVSLMPLGVPIEVLLGVSPWGVSWAGAASLCDGPGSLKYRPGRDRQTIAGSINLTALVGGLAGETGPDTSTALGAESSDFAGHLPESSVGTPLEGGACRFACAPGAYRER